MSLMSSNLLLRAAALALTVVLVAVLTGVTFAGSSIKLGSTPSQTQPASDLPNRGAAEEIRSRGWLNSDRPLRLQDLRGSVVLLEFWTFDCINCIHTLPHVEGWHETYADQGLVTIGVHFPEFGYEHDVQNVRAAAERLGVTYPIALDNDGATWDAYNQRYWPTIYLIDKQGNIRYLTIGEGRYDQTEAAIQALLAETYTPESSAETADAPVYLTPDLVLNVRAGAGLDYDIIGAIQPGMAFVVEGESAGWYQITYGDHNGYVSADYVTVQGS
ncbi:MAG: redoxin domain-containing protein [Anaerolineae bacterium]|nr:redoxin domain-containing protein [Anaerolineae bacterium]